MEIIGKIRQEIERQKEINKKLLDGQLKDGCLYALNQALSFIDTLSEEPVQKFNTGKLQEIAKPATPHKKPTPEDRAKFMEELHEYAESKKPDKDLEEAADMMYPPGINDNLRHAFIAGAEWQKQQTLKDAYVESRVVEDGRIELEGNPLPCLNPIILLPYPQFKPGDKVKMIVLKAEGGIKDD